MYKELSFDLVHASHRTAPIIPRWIIRAVQLIVLGMIIVIGYKVCIAYQDILTSF